MRTRPTEKMMEKSTVNTALAVLVSSATMARRKIIGGVSVNRAMRARDGPGYILRAAPRDRDEQRPTVPCLNVSSMGRTHSSRDFSEGNPQWNLARRSVDPRH